LGSVRRALHALLDRARDRVLVVLFDEYEVFQDYVRDDSLARQLQSVLEEQPRLFFVFAGAQKVETLKGSNLAILLDSAKQLKISFLSPADSRRLIVESAEGLLTFPDEAVKYIQVLTGGHPFYTQALCQSLFNIVHGEGRSEASLDDVERSV